MIFEKYHPIMTNHYALDWLTTFKVKDIFTLRHDVDAAQKMNREPDETIMVTATHVNRVMSEIMHNDALVWGIGDKQTGQFLGTFAFRGFTPDRKTATIEFETIPGKQHAGIMTEVLSHMLSFAFDELNLQRVIADVQSGDESATQLVKGQGFTVVDDVSSVHRFSLKRDER